MVKIRKFTTNKKNPTFLFFICINEQARVWYVKIIHSWFIRDVKYYNCDINTLLPSTSIVGLLFWSSCSTSRNSPFVTNTFSFSKLETSFVSSFFTAYKWTRRDLNVNAINIWMQQRIKLKIGHLLLINW